MIYLEEPPHPVFLLQATLMIPSVVVKPSLEEVQEALTAAGKTIAGVSKGVAQWSAGNKVKNLFIYLFYLQKTKVEEMKICEEYVAGSSMGAEEKPPGRGDASPGPLGPQTDRRGTRRCQNPPKTIVQNRFRRTSDVSGAAEKLQHDGYGEQGSRQSPVHADFLHSGASPGTEITSKAPLKGIDLRQTP